MQYECAYVSAHCITQLACICTLQERGTVSGMICGLIAFTPRFTTEYKRSVNFQRDKRSACMKLIIFCSNHFINFHIHSFFVLKGDLQSVLRMVLRMTRHLCLRDPLEDFTFEITWSTLFSVNNSSSEQIKMAENQASTRVGGDISVAFFYFFWKGFVSSTCK